MRGAFLSKEIARTCDAYALSQFNKVAHDLRMKGAIKWKHAMHLVRILLLGLSALRNGEIAVDVGSHRSKLLAIKKGELPWGNVDMWRRELHEAYGPAFRSTRLPSFRTRRASKRGSSRPGGAALGPFLTPGSCSNGLGDPLRALLTTGVSSWVIGASGGTSGKARTRIPLRGGRARAGPEPDRPVEAGQTPGRFDQAELLLGEQSSFV